MAKYTPGPLAGQLSGAVGNVVFTRNRYGSVLRIRAIPTLVQNDYTGYVRGLMHTVADSWAGLLDAERSAWATWAASNPVVDRLGVPRVLQGNAAYTGINMRAIQSGGTEIRVPPVGPAPTPIDNPVLQVDLAGPVADLTWDTKDVTGTEVLHLWFAMWESAGKSYYKNLLKLCYVGPPTAWLSTSFLTELIARFGALQEGWQVRSHARVCDYATGLVSVDAVSSTVVVDTT